MSNKIRVTYDCDDVLWPLNEVVAKKLGVNVKDVDRYILSETKLSKDVQKAYLKEFANPENFKDIHWYDGIDDVVKMSNDPRVEFMINSGCVNEAVEKVKRAELNKIGFTDDKIHLQLVDEVDAKYEKWMNETDILVEDSLYNINKVNAHCIVLIDTPWNQEHKYPEYESLFTKVFRVYNLVRANRIVWDTIKNSCNQ